MQLIAATTTRTGLNVKSEIDTAIYPPGIKVTDRDMAAINITPHAFHGEWKYTIAPKLERYFSCSSTSPKGRDRTQSPLPSVLSCRRMGTGNAPCRTALICRTGPPNNLRRVSPACGEL